MMEMLCSISLNKLHSANLTLTKSLSTGKSIPMLQPEFLRSLMLSRVLRYNKTWREHHLNKPRNDISRAPILHSSHHAVM